MKPNRLLIIAVLLGSLNMRTFGEDQPKEQKIDAELAKQSVVVLRVKLLKAATAIEKYGWDQVEVLEVLKNQPKADFPKTVEIAHRGGGVPKGESTVYLAHYRTPPDGRLWRLIASSHTEEPKKSEPSDTADSR